MRLLVTWMDGTVQSYSIKNYGIVSGKLFELYLKSGYRHYIPLCNVKEITIDKAQNTEEPYERPIV